MALRSGMGPLALSHLYSYSSLSTSFPFFRSCLAQGSKEPRNLAGTPDPSQLAGTPVDSAARARAASPPLCLPLPGVAATTRKRGDRGPRSQKTKDQRIVRRRFSPEQCPHCGAPVGERHRPRCITWFDLEQIPSQTTSSSSASTAPSAASSATSDDPAGRATTADDPA